MGDAKRRGNLEERVAQARSRGVLPQVGVYVSTKGVPGMRFVVEEVGEPDEDGFFLVSMIDEACAGDPLAAGDELTSDEWFDFVDEHGLIYEPQPAG